MKATARYQALSLRGDVLATGKRLADVEGFGKRIIIDYKGNGGKGRMTIQPRYPLTIYIWSTDWQKRVSRILQQPTGRGSSRCLNTTGQ